MIVSYRQPKGQSIMDNPLAALGTQGAGQRLTKQNKSTTKHNTTQKTRPHQHSGVNNIAK